MHGSDCKEVPVLAQIVAHYEDQPIELKGKVELAQHPLAAARHLRSIDGPVQPNVVYVVVQNPAAPPLLVPFGAYDEWSLRDRYNEAIRIMNTLGASTIECESFRQATRRTWLRLKIASKGPESDLRRVENNAFDFRHVGTGSAPRNPRPSAGPMSLASPLPSSAFSRTTPAKCPSTSRAAIPST